MMKEKARNTKKTEVINILSENTAIKVDLDFFNALLRIVSDKYMIDNSSFSFVQGKNNVEVKIFTSWYKNKKSKDIEHQPFSSTQTYYQSVINKKEIFICNKSLQTEYDKDYFLKKYNLKSCISIPITNKNEHLIGIVTFQSSKVVSDQDLEAIKNIINYFKERIYNELSYFYEKLYCKNEDKNLSIRFNQTKVAIVEWDENHKIAQWNLAAEKIFGYKKQEILGKDVFTIVPKYERENVKKVLSRLDERKEEIRNINNNIRKDKKEITCEWYNLSLFSPFYVFLFQPHETKHHYKKIGYFYCKE